MERNYENTGNKKAFALVLKNMDLNKISSVQQMVNKTIEHDGSHKKEWLLFLNTDSEYSCEILGLNLYLISYISQS